LHIKLHTDSWQLWLLVGETPLLAAMADIAFGNAFAKQQMHLLANQARPLGSLTWCWPV
jgi:hypothetical protein